MSSWIPPEFASMPPPKRKKLNYTPRANKSISKKNTTITTVKDCENWIENFDPEIISELAVHSRKVQDVKDWITNAINSPKKCRILLLTGPSGAGKTATIKVICKELGLTLNEWISPMDVVQFEQDSYNSGFKSNDKQCDIFIDFILKASRYNSIFDENCKGRLVLVEDFPNYLVRDPGSIATVLGKFTERGKSPLVFICTDTAGKSINISKNLFTDSICQQFQIDHISFNPVSNTGIKSALVRALTIMPLLTKCNIKYVTPNSETMEAIIQSAAGDIRSALNNLLFSSMKDYAGKVVELEPVFEQLPWTLQTPRGSKKSRPGKQKSTKLKNYGRDETLTLLHGVGRVLNPKRVMYDTRYTFTHPIEETSNSFMSMHKVFLNFLHRNYLTHFQCIEDITPAAEYLSLADVLCVDYLESDTSAYALWMSIGALQVFNLEPVKTWAPVKAPVKVELNFPSCDELNLDINHAARKKVLAMDYKTYCRIIKSKHDESVNEISEDEDVMIEEFSDSDQN